jgi:hypothetical protein
MLVEWRARVHSMSVTTQTNNTRHTVHHRTKHHELQWSVGRHVDTMCHSVSVSRQEGEWPLHWQGKVG